MFRDKTGGREPTLKDFSYFISTESLTENDPVYRRSNSTPVKVKADISKKSAFHPRFKDSMRVITLATDVSKPKPTELKYSSFYQRHLHDCELSQLKFHITSTSEEGPDLPVNHALKIEDLNVSNRYCPNQVDLSEWPHLRDVELPNHPVDVSEVSVLIGQDVPQAHIIFDYRWGNDLQNELYATKTPFGCTKSIEDKRALKIVRSTTKVEGGRYEAGRLWQNEDPILPNNKQAEMRLQQLKKRFLLDPTFASQYEAVMDDYIEKGYAVKLSEKEAASTSDHTWYLPHHAVVNPNKSKVEYDAAAVWGGTSLNKELVQGPQLNNSLIGVLFRFRKEEIAVASDIESMFHRVGCVDRDKDALRFLWWSDGLNESPSDHKMKVHLFGKADSPCIAAWTLQRTATDNATEFGNDVCDIVRKNFYVDDCLFSVPTAEEAIGASLQLMQMLRRGNFRLTKFISNYLKVLKAVPAEERTVKSLDLDKLPLERTLGLHWDTETGTLAVKVSLSHGKANCHTRRDCLSKLCSTFDPLGLICPVLLPAKRLMQKTWQLQLDWDDSLPEGLLEGWTRWKEEPLLLNHLSIPRCYFSGDQPFWLEPIWNPPPRNPGYALSRDASFELHHFSDASEYGYGTVCYLRKESGDELLNPLSSWPEVAVLPFSTFLYQDCTREVRRVTHKILITDSSSEEDCLVVKV
ncbi:uncharacterized protein [Montipora foliosa]|uniref:uncharacterized protein n=1 Tax=Montipora foliosa TaxID=591990 RepID=UPI0035F1F888